MADILEPVSKHWPMAVSVVVLLIAASIVPSLTSVLSLSKLPLTGKELGSSTDRRTAYVAGARRIYQAGYEKFRNLAFRVTTTRDTTVVVVPREFLPELRKLPDNVLSMSAAIDEALEAKYTRMENDAPLVPHTIKSNLNPALVRLNPVIHKETSEALALELPNGSDWEEVNVHHAILRVVTKISGRVFVGADICHDEEYIDLAMNYTNDIAAVLASVAAMKPWQRPFLANRTAAAKQLDKRIKHAHDFFNPIIAERRANIANGSPIKHDDMLQWMMEKQPNFTDKASKNLVQMQLGLTAAAIHTTAMTVMNSFFDLVAMPQFIPELLEEADQALAENDGVFTSRALQSMKKMDSVLKEAIRFSPPSMTSFNRKVLVPFDLPNGQHLPAGVTIEVPTVAVNGDSSIFENAAKFEPLRHFHMRAANRENDEAKAAAQNQFVSVSTSNLTFGYGRHACPGRFFAANEMKMLLATALSEYEFKMPEENAVRYPNVEFAHMVGLPPPITNTASR